MKKVFIITVNDDYGRELFIDCFDYLKEARAFVKDHSFLRNDSTAKIRQFDF